MRIYRWKFLAFALIISMMAILSATSLSAQVQVQKYLGDKLFYVFDKNIHTVQVYPAGRQLGEPVIRLGYGEQLTCSFDDFDFSGKNYSYTLYHCDPHWNISEIITQNDYLSGYYYEDNIKNYTSSFNSLRDYMHYSFSFPNEYINIKYSGNYALVVYTNSVDEPAFIARFYVTENAVDVAASVGFSKNPEFLTSKQRVSFSINTSNFRINDPYRDLLVFVTQNDRPYSKQGSIQPIGVSGSSIIYDFQDKFEFSANNEFRFVDFSNVKYLSRKIYAISVDKSEYHIVILPEATFKGKPYMTTFDVNGKFQVQVKDNDNAPIEAEYAYVYFTLADKIPFQNNDVYICGNFNGWQFNDDNRMTYNYEKGYFEGDLYLKQGHYDYTYVIKRSDNGMIMDYEMDGSYVETKNEYKIFVYHKSAGDDYYKLLSYAITGN